MLHDYAFCVNLLKFTISLKIFVIRNCKLIIVYCFEGNRSINGICPGSTKSSVTAAYKQAYGEMHHSIYNRD